MTYSLLHARARVRLLAFLLTSSHVLSSTGEAVKATISPNDLSFVNKLGMGAFGDVWEVLRPSALPSDSGLSSGFASDRAQSESLLRDGYEERQP